jgi:hypothetical protein
MEENIKNEPYTGRVGVELFQVTHDSQQWRGLWTW